MSRGCGSAAVAPQLAALDVPRQRFTRPSSRAAPTLHFEGARFTLETIVVRRACSIGPRGFHPRNFLFLPVVLPVCHSPHATIAVVIRHLITSPFQSPPTPPTLAVPRLRVQPFASTSQ